LADIDPADYCVVFYPGGHGPMEDLAEDADSGRILTTVLESGRPLALLCHAPAATLAARREDGTWPFEGYRMTALSNTEERLNRFSRKAKWLLEDRLVESGAIYRKGRLPLRPFIVVDRNLYTGQNPASSATLAHKLVSDQGSAALHVWSAGSSCRSSPVRPSATSPPLTTDSGTHAAMGLPPAKICWQPHRSVVSVEHGVQRH
jgi:putative intracellular protease/amidase